MMHYMNGIRSKVAPSLDGKKKNTHGGKST